MRHWWIVLIALGATCGEPMQPEAPGLPAGTYHVAELHYRSTCYVPDTLTIDGPPFVENTLVYRLSPADSVRGIFDALPDGRLTVTYRGGGVQEDGVIAMGPEYGQYAIVNDTLWIAMVQTRWLGAVPYTEWRDGTLAGTLAQGCETLSIRLTR